MLYYDWAVLASSACITVIIEVITLLIFKVKDLRLLISVPLNIATNVLLNTVLQLQGNTGFVLYSRVVIFELLIILFEAIIYQLLHKDKKNYLYSSVANIASFIIGSLVIYIVFIVVLK